MPLRVKKKLPIPKTFLPGPDTLGELDGVDSETTGTDQYHGAKPFFISICDEQFDQDCWEVDVDPETREPDWSEEDVQQVKERLDNGRGKVIQNPMFDVQAFSTIGIKDWDWSCTWDTLRMAHLLASNQPHDLTTLAVIYGGVNIDPYEAILEKFTKECRNIARRDYSTWRIAAKDSEEMPSAYNKQKLWKYDGWLLRAVAKERKLPIKYSRDGSIDRKNTHPYWYALSDYGNADSAVLIPVFNEMKRRVVEKGQWEIYLTVIKVLPIALKMQRYGITISKERTYERKKQFTRDAEEAAEECLKIAKSYGYDLVLPKGGANNSLRSFVFDVMKLEPFKGGKKKKTEAPSLDKDAMRHWSSILDATSREGCFLENLSKKRKRSTAVSYLEGYERYWLPTGVWRINYKTGRKEQLWYRLYPSLNPTGTDTLRWSCTNPNEQNISKQDDGNLRYCFGPMPGREWWAIDATNIELRIPAYEAGEEAMIALFERPNDPPFFGSNHLLNFSIVYPKIWAKLIKDVGPEKAGLECKRLYKATWHQYVKNGGFAIQYGAMEETSDRAFHSAQYSKEWNGGVEVSCFHLLKSRFAKMSDHNEWCIQYANDHGYVETIPDKTVNPNQGYPLLCTRSKYGGILPTVPLNYRTQGTAMWWMTKSMLRCDEFLTELNRSDTLFRSFLKRSKTKEEREGGYHLIMQVHDELDFDFPKVPNQGNRPIVRELERLMVMGGDDIGIPTPVGTSYHPINWAEEEK